MQEVKTLNRKGTKKEREKFQDDCTMFSIQFGDIIRASEWEEEITTLSREIENWKLKYKNLENEKKKLLNHLPEKLDSDVIQGETVEEVKKLWMIQNWINDFTALGTKRKGYHFENVTCYMPAAAYHLGNMMSKYKNIKQFSCQGVENNNHTARPLSSESANSMIHQLKY
ncbi:uncharacterized protein LOC116295574 [Actinia tenebrosa]|uniref:Uncharacterized protein LOC116295574 n=1 Tax=Actinia tenebrosa TaxID=6105 RepID=A0A6P8I304_ACTTE|nr:uncharacterized protein LOC116295574 [Actinia tenebrosa]